MYTAPYAALAPRYDELVGRRFFSGLRPAFEELVRRYGLRFGSAVDLGCGTGLFACWLARRYGIPMIGVDRSPAMLQAAIANCRDCRVGFLLQDIRDLRLPCRVELATANFDTLNHVLTECDFQRVLARVFASLEPGGHFVFDLLTHRHDPGGRWIGVRSSDKRSTRLLQRTIWSEGSALLFTRVTVLERGAAPRLEDHVERGYDPVRVARWLEAAGYEIRGLLDAPTLAYAHRRSARVIFVTRRPYRSTRLSRWMSSGSST